MDIKQSRGQLISFFFSCILEPGKGKNQHNVINYVMGGNINTQFASQLLQQFIVLEAVKQSKAEAEKPKKP